MQRLVAPVRHVPSTTANPGVGGPTTTTGPGVGGPTTTTGPGVGGPTTTTHPGIAAPGDFGTRLGFCSAMKTCWRYFLTCMPHDQYAAFFGWISVLSFGVGCHGIISALMANGDEVTCPFQCLEACANGVGGKRVLAEVAATVPSPTYHESCFNIRNSLKLSMVCMVLGYASSVALLIMLRHRPVWGSYSHSSGCRTTLCQSTEGIGRNDLVSWVSRSLAEGVVYGWFYRERGEDWFIPHPSTHKRPFLFDFPEHRLSSFSSCFPRLLNQFSFWPCTVCFAFLLSIGLWEAWAIISVLVG
ncbi:unnamed protein product [Ectocarpus sp. 6 AP-2014]